MVFGSDSLHILQMGFIFVFSVFTLLFLSLSFLLFILRLKPWCTCDKCKDLLNSTWSIEFHSLCDWYSHLLRKSSTGTIHFHVLNNVITANPKNVEHILKTRFENYPKGKQFSNILGDFLGRGIFNVDGDSWKFQRKIASHELGSVCVRSYAFETVTSEVKNRLIPLLSNKGGLLDLQDVFRRFSFDTICKFSFGLDPGCLESSLPACQLTAAFDLASRISAERAMTAFPLIWKIKRFFNVGSEKKLKEAIKLVDSLVSQIIKHKRGTRSSTHDKDLLSRFMVAIDDDKYLRDIIVSFLLAGRDTVASGLTCFFWLLTKHPEIKQRIQDESNEIMGSSQELATFDQMKNMHYLQAAIHESLRLYPPVQFDSKFCKEDDMLPDGTFIKRGTRVTYHPYAMGRMQSIWGSDCLDFKPERWLQDGLFKPAVNSFEYPVFQAGARVCLGKDMALMEMKTVALSLIRHFDFQMAKPSSQKTIKFAPSLTATVLGGLLVSVHKEEICHSGNSSNGLRIADESIDLRFAADVGRVSGGKL